MTTTTVLMTITKFQVGDMKSAGQYCRLFIGKDGKIDKQRQGLIFNKEDQIIGLWMGSQN